MKRVLGREERENGIETISEEITVDNFLYLIKGIKEAQSIVITTKSLVTLYIN